MKLRRLLPGSCIATAIALLFDHAPVSRRNAIAGIASAAGAAAVGTPASSAAVPGRKYGSVPGNTITLPLEDCGGSFCTLFTVENEVFRGVLDTGSPFLAVANSCTKRWGCYAGQGVPSGLTDTFECYAGNQGNVQWRKGLLELGFLRSDLPDEGFIFSKVIFGVLDDALVHRPGGVFFGLVKYKSDEIRPTFLSQTDIQAISFDFPARQLILSRSELIPGSADAVPLLDLRPLGDPVMHYATRASRVVMSSRSLSQIPNPKTGAPKHLYVVFDTGTSGMALSRELYNQEDLYSRINGSRPFRDVVVEVQSEKGRTLQLYAKRPLTTAVDIPWAGFNDQAHLIVLGLEFLQNLKLTIDVDAGRLIWKENYQSVGIV